MATTIWFNTAYGMVYADAETVHRWVVEAWELGDDNAIRRARNIAASFRAQHST